MALPLDAVLKGIEAGEQAHVHRTGGRGHGDAAIREGEPGGDGVEVGRGDTRVDAGHGVEAQAVDGQDQQVHGSYPDRAATGVLIK